MDCVPVSVGTGETASEQKGLPRRGRETWQGMKCLQSYECFRGCRKCSVSCKRASLGTLSTAPSLGQDPRQPWLVWGKEEGLCPHLSGANSPPGPSASVQQGRPDLQG